VPGARWGLCLRCLWGKPGIGAPSFQQSAATYERERGITCGLDSHAASATAVGTATGRMYCGGQPGVAVTASRPRQTGGAHAHRARDQTGSPNHQTLAISTSQRAGTAAQDEGRCFSAMLVTNCAFMQICECNNLQMQKVGTLDAQNRRCGSGCSVVLAVTDHKHRPTLLLLIDATDQLRLPVVRTSLQSAS
jgi:hypothetical protein